MRLCGRGLASSCELPANGLLSRLRKTLVWNLFEEGWSLPVPLNSLIFVIPNRFSGEESAFASFSASCIRRVMQEPEQLEANS